MSKPTHCMWKAEYIYIYKSNHQYLQQEESNFGFKTHLGKLPSSILILIKQSLYGAHLWLLLYIKLLYNYARKEKHSPTQRKVKQRKNMRSKKLDKAFRLICLDLYTFFFSFPLFLLSMFRLHTNLSSFLSFYFSFYFPKHVQINALFMKVIQNHTREPLRGDSQEPLHTQYTIHSYHINIRSYHININLKYSHH